jgi:hypothetical protein
VLDVRGAMGRKEKLKHYLLHPTFNSLCCIVEIEE